MYVLFYFRDRFMVSREQDFKAHFADIGADFIRQSTNFDELYELSTSLKMFHLNT